MEFIFTEDITEKQEETDSLAATITDKGPQLLTCCQLKTLIQYVVNVKNTVIENVFLPVPQHRKKTEAGIY